MKNTVLLTFITSAVWASAATSDRPFPREDQQRTDTRRESSTEPAGSVTFTNRNGETFSANQLADQLQELRTVIDRTMPMLSAFNENFATNAGQQSVAGTISSILSGVLNRNTNSNPAGSSEPRSSSTTTNLLGVLQGVLGTNGAPGSTQVSHAALQQLQQLQNQLQPIPPLLNALNVTGSEGGQVIGRSPDRSTGSVRPPTPTGRDEGNPPL